MRQHVILGKPLGKPQEHRMMRSTANRKASTFEARCVYNRNSEHSKVSRPGKVFEIKNFPSQKFWLKSAVRILIQNVRSVWTFKRRESWKSLKNLESRRSLETQSVWLNRVRLQKCHWWKKSKHPTFFWASCWLDTPTWSTKQVPGHRFNQVNFEKWELLTEIFFFFSFLHLLVIEQSITIFLIWSSDMFFHQNSVDAFHPENFPSHRIYERDARRIL